MLAFVFQYLICLVCVSGVLLGGAIYCNLYRVQVIYQKQFSYSGRVKSSKNNFYFLFFLYKFMLFENQAVEILMLTTYNCTMKRKAKF